MSYKSQSTVNVPHLPLYYSKSTLVKLWHLLPWNPQ